MGAMKVGTPVLVFAQAASTFRGVRGVIVRMAEHTAAAWVLLEGQPHPLCFGLKELVRADDEPHVTAGE